MKYVLDASVALKWVLPESESPLAIRLRDAYRSGTHELIVQDIFNMEIAYALAKVFHRGKLSQTEASQSLAEVLAVSPNMYATGPILPRAFEIATRLRVSLYDSLYVALAEERQCELVTADRRLVNALAPHFTQLVELSAIP